MFKALKWAYDRGREYERMRLKKLARQLQLKVVMKQKAQYYSPKEDEAKKSEREKFEQAVNDQVIQVLDRMIYPQPNEQYAPKLEPSLIDNEK